jgi:hypothetical protein
VLEPLVAPTLKTRPEPAAMSPSTLSEATPVPALVTVRVESDELFKSRVKAVADFCRVVVLEPRMTVPPPASRVKELEPSEVKEMEPALAAVSVTCRKWLVPLAPWISKMLPEVAVPEVCLKTLPELLAVGAKVLVALSRAMLALSDRLLLAIVLQLPPVTKPPVEAKEET